nr:hypothetical protein [Defluviimonas sp.]
MGRLPVPVKIGSRLYWSEAEVEVAVEAHRTRNRASALKQS